MVEVRLRIERGEVFEVIANGIPLVLRKPIPLSRIGEVIDVVNRFVEFFDLKRTFDRLSEYRYERTLEELYRAPLFMPTDVEELYRKLYRMFVEGVLKARPKYSIFVVRVLDILVSRDFVDREELVRESGILEEARKRGVKPGKFLAGVLGGLNRRSQRIGLGKIIEKTPDGKYYIPQRLRSILASCYYNVVKQSKQ